MTTTQLDHSTPSNAQARPRSTDTTGFDQARHKNHGTSTETTATPLDAPRASPSASNAMPDTHKNHGTSTETTATPLDAPRASPSASNAMPDTHKNHGTSAETTATPLDAPRASPSTDKSTSDVSRSNGTAGKTTTTPLGTPRASSYTHQSNLHNARNFETSAEAAATPLDTTRASRPTPKTMQNDHTGTTPRASQDASIRPAHDRQTQRDYPDHNTRMNYQLAPLADAAMGKRRNPFHKTGQTTHPTVNLAAITTTQSEEPPLQKSRIHEPPPTPCVAAFLEEELAKFEGLAGISHIAQHTIYMKDDKPVKQRYYPKTPAMQKIIDDQVDELLREGRIEASKSPHSAPIVLVGKKDRRDAHVRRLQTTQRQIYTGRLSAPQDQPHPRETPRCPLHLDIGPEEWVLANPDGGGKSGMHCIYRAR
ncbi:flocculation protein FLO11-like [Drosophila obscura]|uniref:flocculation protein FLO11-like n=1 Tax=Drosophila obscura TaxID=7282 RepID=UPI001BB247E5|nr:flocculation protein FLO11-like [Drosophila obscura]